jgi:ATP-dependent protease ClpP protease subunit
MAYTPKRFYIGQPGTSATTLATVPSGKTWIVKQICLANTTASDATVTIHLVPSGGSAGVGNMIVPGITVYAKSVVTVDLAQVMTAGDFIAGLQGTTSAITVTISGVEVG